MPFNRQKPQAEPELVGGGHLSRPADLFQVSQVEKQVLSPFLHKISP